jgi:hypothetical protein
MRFKAADLDNRLVETTCAVGYHEAANLATTLATTQSALIASELALALQANVTPSVASTSDMLVITLIIGTPAAWRY